MSAYSVSKINSDPSMIYVPLHESMDEPNCTSYIVRHDDEKTLYYSSVYYSSGTGMTFNGTYTYMNTKNDGGYVYMQQSPGIISSLYLFMVDGRFRIGYNVMDSDSILLHNESWTLDTLHLQSPHCDTTPLHLDAPDPRVEQNFTFAGYGYCNSSVYAGTNYNISFLECADKCLNDVDYDKYGNATRCTGFALMPEGWSSRKYHRYCGFYAEPFETSLDHSDAVKKHAYLSDTGKYPTNLYEKIECYVNNRR
jgi:hypothetical protein